MPSTQLTNQQIHENLHQGMHNLLILTTDLLVLVSIISGLVCLILFTCSLYKTMKKVPVEKRIFPNWFIWMRFIPFFGYVFDWMMLPFGIPAGLRNAVSGNQEALAKAGQLKIAGLAYMLFASCFLLLVFIFQSPMVKILAEMTVLISMITYWVKIVSFRKNYLK